MSQTKESGPLGGMRRARPLRSANVYGKKRFFNTDLYGGSGDVRVAGAQLILSWGHVRERLADCVRIQVWVLRNR